MLTRSILSVLSLLALSSLRLAHAQVVSPSSGGEVSPRLVTATTLELSFGTQGTGQGRLVAIVAIPDGMPVPLAAADSTFYTADPVYGKGSALGKGFIVYCGTGHAVTVTGLKPSMRYYVINAEYNTDGVSIMYNNRGSSFAIATRAASPTALATVANSAQAIELYPNPSLGQAVNIEVKGYANEPLALRLADALGRQVWAQSLTPTVANYQAPLPLPASLAAGTYVLTLSGSSGQLQKRLTITQ